MKRIRKMAAALCLFSGVVFLFCGSALAIHGTVQVITFNGPVTGQSVTFSLYLPPGYHTSTNRFPVIIHLHGIGGSHAGGQTNLIPSSLEAAVSAGVIEPCLVAFPNGYGDSFWANSANSNKPAETNIRDEIIPYIDANFRTIPERRRRVIQGFSMGGFGAAKFAAKFPELFVACVVYDGAMLNWSQIQQRHPVQAQEIFNNSSTVFDSFSPWHWMSENGAVLRDSIPFRDVVGNLVNENRAWRDALLAQGITASYVETGAPHSLGPLLDLEGTNSWAFIRDAFEAADSGDFKLKITRLGNDALLQWPLIGATNYNVEFTSTLSATNAWQPLVSNLVSETFVHTGAITQSSGFYRVRANTNSSSQFTFNWSGTNFTYTDQARTFSGILLKPQGAGPYPAVVINHGAGGTPTDYSFNKAREMQPWGLIAMAPTLTHVAGGETNPVNMGYCAENLERVRACVNVLRSFNDVDTNRLAIFGHSMGAFATVGSASVLTNVFRAGAITAGGIIPDAAGTNNAAPTTTEASTLRAPFLMIHCDADPIVPAMRSQLLQQLLNSNAVVNQRILISSNSIPNPIHWHNIHQDSNVNGIILTNVQQWFLSNGILP